MSGVKGETLTATVNPRYPNYPRVLEWDTDFENSLSLVIPKSNLQALLDETPPIVEAKLRDRRTVNLVDYVLGPAVIDRFFPGETIKNPLDSADPLNMLEDIVKSDELVKVNPYFASDRIGLGQDWDHHMGLTSDPFAVVRTNVAFQLLTAEPDIQLSLPEAEEMWRAAGRLFDQIGTYEGIERFEDDPILPFYDRILRLRDSLSSRIKTRIGEKLVPHLEDAIKAGNFELARPINPSYPRDFFPRETRERPLHPHEPMEFPPLFPYFSGNQPTQQRGFFTLTDITYSL